MLAWQAGCITPFVEDVRAPAWSRPEAGKRQVFDRAMRYLPADQRRFLTELSGEAAAASLGLLLPTAK
jgi:hypothetical protein